MLCTIIIKSPINGYAAMAQSVERVLGKDEVTGSIPVSSSILKVLKSDKSKGFQNLFYFAPFDRSS